MPTWFVGLHLAIVSLVALFGLSFLLDPCGGGGDLCPGGVVAVAAFGVAGFGLAGLAVWRLGGRASPLFVLDCLLVAVLGPIALTTGGPAWLAILGLQAVLLLSLAGAALAGRAVVANRLETILSLAVLASLATLRDAGGIGVLVVGLAALAVGWGLMRMAPATPAKEGPPAEPPPEVA